MKSLAVLSSILALCGAVLVPGARAQSTTRVNVTAAGAQVSDGNAEAAALSGTGRFVAFYTDQPGLVPEDTNDLNDVFVRDRLTGTITRVSVSTAGVPANSESDFPSISADGRFVAFRSFAINLDPADGDNQPDIYLRDLQAGTTTLVSKNSAGVASGGNSTAPSISADGRWIAFESSDIHLVDDDTNGMIDIFVHDRISGSTSRVNLMNIPPPPPDKPQATDHSFGATVSGDGRFVAFASDAGNLVGSDLNGVRDVFVRDRQLGTTTRLSQSAAGVAGDGNAQNAAISADGASVAFDSTATNLVPGDTNAVRDIFVKSLGSSAIERVSVSSAGVQGNVFSLSPSVSSDGRYVAFESVSSTLVLGDTNATTDIFVRDRQLGLTTRASLTNTGLQADKGSQLAAISGDGRLVSWNSPATNLVAGDTNGETDIFVRDPGGCTGAGGWNGYGTGLAGAGGIVPALSGDPCPLPGALITLHLDGAVGGAPGSLFIGLASASAPFKGGTFRVGALFLTLNIAVGGTPGAAGAGALNLPALLPGDPALSGLSLYMQAAFKDLSAIQKVSLTQGLQMTIG